VVALVEERAGGCPGAAQAGQAEAQGVTTDRQGGWARGREEGTGSEGLVEVVRGQEVVEGEECRADRPEALGAEEWKAGAQVEQVASGEAWEAQGKVKMVAPVA
jgi:hypothetical protein